MRSREEKALRKLVKQHQDLNPSQVTELQGAPSPVEFGRFVAGNRPVVMRGAGRDLRIPALERWTDEYLVEKLAERELDISATPEGNADAVVDGVFVEPASVKMTLSTLFVHLREEQDDPQATSPVFYLQSQNGNLAGEYAALQDDVGRDGPGFARDVFGQPPDVANIWIGGRRSKTSLHKDPYENLYLVVRGTKTFTLFPPVEEYCMHERLFPHASYHPSLARQQYPRFALARPLRVTLCPGDLLYLPALWFHRVVQDVGWGPDGAPGLGGGGGGGGTRAAVAVNWWTDMDFGAPAWGLYGLVRRLTLALDGREEETDSDEEEEEEEENKPAQ